MVHSVASNLHYGLFDERGNIDVYLTFDHCVFDGAVAARALSETEATLREDIRRELLTLAGEPSFSYPFRARGEPFREPLSFSDAAADEAFV
jgi:hypothetical protein